MGDVNPLRWPRRMLDRLCAGRADYAAFRQRQRSAAYRARKNRCRWLWILSGVIMLIHPQPSFVIVLFLGTTFLCLALLDEA